VLFDTVEGERVVTVSTPAIQPDEATDVSVPIPLGGWNPDLTFRIVVDYHNEVDESSKFNNIADGTCLG
jgi:hypothetical protein